MLSCADGHRGRAGRSWQQGSTRCARRGRTCQYEQQAALRGGAGRRLSTVIDPTAAPERCLACGSGRSFDNRHIGALPQFGDVAVADVMKLRDDAEFIDINKPATKRFPLVIACEVVEHFLDPATEFPALFGHVDKDGLLVCSTNVYDGSNMGSHKYIFTPGHTSYYTPEALIHLAKANGFHVDFRLPLVATGYGGPRKRYVFFTRDASMLTDIARFFGKHMYAPSEKPWANKELAEAQKQVRDQEPLPRPAAAA